MRRTMQNLAAGEGEKVGVLGRGLCNKRRESVSQKKSK